MADKKSIIDEAKLDIVKIQNALNSQTKEMLRSLAKEEINSIVKESLQEKDYEEEDLEDQDELSDDELDDETGDEELDDDLLGGLEGSEEETEMEPEMDSELGMDTDDVLDNDEIDMTGASDEEVFAIYKKMINTDEIEIVGDEAKITITEPGEYLVKMPKAPAAVSTDDKQLDLEGPEDYENGFEDHSDFYGDDDDDIEIDTSDEDEIIKGNKKYTGDEELDLEAAPKRGHIDVFGDGNGEEDEYEIEGGDDLDLDDEYNGEDEEKLNEVIPVGSGEAHRVPYKAKLGQPKGAGADNLKESNNTKKIISETNKKYNVLLTEHKNLKAENEQFKIALKTYRTTLVETVVYNSNLSYVTKLFLEHSTTKAEKKNILKRFDGEVTNLKESKKLYHSILNELQTRKPITESIGNEVIQGATTGTSKQLNESTAFVDQETKRMIQLIKYKY